MHISIIGAHVMPVSIIAIVRYFRRAEQFRERFILLALFTRDRCL